MKNIILRGTEKFFKSEYKIEKELTNIFSKHYQFIVSKKSFWVPIEKQLKSKKFKNFKHSIGDGFLLVWDNPTTPTLYITEIELEKHDINKHILPQLGNFISFIQSSTTEELNNMRNFIYKEIKKNSLYFNNIRNDTNKEVYELLDNSMEDLQILLVIDRVAPELSIGLGQIEKAINVKIRKIEVSRFLNEKNDEIILFTDSEVFEEEKTLIIEEYTFEYHLENKPDKIVNIVKKFLQHVKGFGLRVSPMKHYIGIYKNKNMIFSCVVRKNSVIFYSKLKITDLELKELQMRDVRNIGHYTNHLPTEIVLTEIDQVENLLNYFDKIYKKY